MMGNPCLPDRQAFEISQQKMGLSIITLPVFMKIKRAIYGSVLAAAQAGTMANPFEIIQRKMVCPIMILTRSLKTKPGNFGLAQGAMPAFMMERHLPFSS